MNPESACDIGLIPISLKDRIVPVGNAAGEGSKIALINREELFYSDILAKEISLWSWPLLRNSRTALWMNWNFRNNRE